MSISYRTILLLNIVSVLEALGIKLCIDHHIIVCNVVGGLTSNCAVIAFVAVKNLLTLGGYQLYFWVQRHHDPSRRIMLHSTAFDRWVPALPQAYWIYSPLYYVVFNLAFLALPNYNITVLNAWLMLMHASFWFLRFPTRVDPILREQVRHAPMDKATRLIMELVHAHDSEDNACPSMHCALAMFIALILYPFYPFFAILFPVLVVLSCLVCKQHLIVDIVPGLALGALHGWINLQMHQL